MFMIHVILFLLLACGSVAAQTVPVLIPEGVAYLPKEEPPHGYYDFLAQQIVARDSAFKIVRKPLRRVLQELEDGGPMAVLPLLRLPQRAARLHWIGPVVRSDFVFLSLDRVISTDAEASPFSIGVWQSTGMEAALKDRRLPHIVPQEARSLPYMLRAGRIDLWYAPRHEALYIWQMLDLSPPLKVGQPLETHDLWMAVTPAVPAPLRDRLDQLMQAILAENLTNGVNARFFIDPPVSR